MNGDTGCRVDRQIPEASVAARAIDDVRPVAAEHNVPVSRVHNKVLVAAAVALNVARDVNQSAGTVVVLIRIQRQREAVLNRDRVVDVDHAAVVGEDRHVAGDRRCRVRSIDDEVAAVLQIDVAADVDRSRVRVQRQRCQNPEQSAALFNINAARLIARSVRSVVPDVNPAAEA